MPLSAQTQDDFSGGIYSGRKAPADTVYDIVNGLINDEGLPFRRGGSAYYSASNTTGTPIRLHAPYMRAVRANRVLAAVPSGSLYALNGSLAPVAVGSLGATWSRAASIDDFAVFASAGSTNFTYYGGSQKSLTSTYGTGTVSVTNGSTAVTGSGTSWLANVDAGMILSPNAGGIGVVEKVISDTSITLASPWAYSTVAGGNYALLPTYAVGTSEVAGGADATVTQRPFIIAAGSGSPRLLYCVGNRVYYTPRGTPLGFVGTDYHELPANVTIVGAEGRGDSALIFTTGGVWTITNLSFDDVDAFGNIQQAVEQISKDVILWDDFGIAGFSGGLVIPCVDDVFVATADFSLTPITGRIRPKYRAYVKAGYQPGQAAVHRGHYILPILNGTSLVDVLVCRLDRGAAWTTWAGHAAGVAYAPLTAEVARAPKLLGLAGSRVTDLTGCFDPGAATDADGTNSDFSLTTRDYPTGASQPGVAHKIRARYELASSSVATVAVAYSSDQDAGSFTTLTSRGGQNGTAGWSDSDGSLYQWANVGKKRERIRFKLTVAGACTRFVLRSVELLTRPSGKQ